MNNRPMYFKTDMIFHNSYLNKLETAIETNNNLNEQEKNNLIKPLYKFYEFSIKKRSKETPEKIIRGNNESRKNK
jgi:hypothetical protein